MNRFGWFYPTKTEETCGIAITAFQLHCTPEPDAFNPCEDLIGNWVLRMGVWTVCTLAVLGNLTLFTITILSTKK